MIDRIAWLLLFFILLASSTALCGQMDMFAHRYEYKPEEVLNASRFVEKNGYWEGYQNTKLTGYVFLSKEWTEKLIGYSGKHMETLVGMDTEGNITGVKILFHSEPIVLIGLKEKNYHIFLEQYVGKNIKENLKVGNGISIDAITGATVTAVVQNAIILRSAMKVAVQTGMFEFSKGPEGKIKKEFDRLSWQELLDSGAIKNITVTNKELGLEGKGDYLDLYFGLVTVPSIGRNVLGDPLYQETISGLEENDLAIFIFSRGEGSFKGSGFARGGAFDRFNIEQEDRLYIFRDKDYRPMTDIKAEGAPEMQEGGLFIVKGKDFVEGRPFKFNLVLSYRLAGRKEFKSFMVDYQIPGRFLD